MGTVQLTQFMYPNGGRKQTSVDLPDDICMMAEGQILSCEMMPNDWSKVVFYSRKSEWDEEDEDCEIADNGPGDNSPKNALTRLIQRVNASTKDGAADTEEVGEQPTTAPCGSEEHNKVTSA